MPFLQKNFLWIMIAIFIGKRFLNDAFSDPRSFILNIAYLIPGIIIGITVHEFAHAYAAYKLGDDTPKIQGRVTLNPIAHIDPIGLVCLFLGGFGWGKPVEVNPYNFRNQRRDDLIVDLAGVVTNFIFAALFTGVLKAFIVFAESSAAMTGEMASIIYTVILYIIQMNLVLMIFNLIPVPPLDGFGVVTNLFDLRSARWYGFVYTYGNFILFALILSGITSRILTPAIEFLSTFLFNIFGMGQYF